jgi:hypothetical protein
LAKGIGERKRPGVCRAFSRLLALLIALLVGLVLPALLLPALLPGFVLPALLLAALILLTALIWIWHGVSSLDFTYCFTLTSIAGRAFGSTSGSMARRMVSGAPTATA